MLKHSLLRLIFVIASLALCFAAGVWNEYADPFLHLPFRLSLYTLSVIIIVIVFFITHRLMGLPDYRDKYPYRLLLICLLVILAQYLCYEGGGAFASVFW